MCLYVCECACVCRGGETSVFILEFLNMVTLHGYRFACCDVYRHFWHLLFNELERQNRRTFRQKFKKRLTYQFRCMMLQICKTTARGALAHVSKIMYLLCVWSGAEINTLTNIYKRRLASTDVGSYARGWRYNTDQNPDSLSYCVAIKQSASQHRDQTTELVRTGKNFCWYVRCPSTGRLFWRKICIRICLWKALIMHRTMH